MLPLHEPNEAKRDGINMKVVFSTRAFAAILAETTEKIKTETGGLFLGKYKDGIWYVVEAIDPGPKSVFEVAYFEYDRAYTQHLIRKTANLYASKLELIGLWHRHPGSFDIFSSTDDETNAKYAKLMSMGQYRSGFQTYDVSCGQAMQVFKNKIRSRRRTFSGRIIGAEKAGRFQGADEKTEHIQRL